MQIEKECIYCHKMFLAKDARVKTCNTTCGYAYRSMIQKQNHPKLTCVICGKFFDNKNYSKKKTCSPKCAEILRKCTCIERLGVDNPSKSSAVIAAREVNSFKKRGVKHPAQDPEVKAKTAATRAQISKEEINNTKTKRKETTRTNWGVDNVFQHEDVKTKSKATNRKKLGVDYAMQASSVREKSVKTCRRKYNEDNVARVPAIKKAKANTCMNKFGEDNFSKTELGKQTIVASNIKKYNAHSKTQSDAYVRVSHLENPDNEIVDMYVNQHIPITKIAQICGTGETFIATILNNHNITIQQFESMGEREVREYIISLGLKVMKHDRKILLHNKEIDIPIPDKLIGVEYNGLYYHSERVLASRHTVNVKKYHLLKTIEAEKKGVHLIHIFEDDWIYKKDIVKSRLAQVLGVSDKSYYARKCTVAILSYLETKKFLDTYHIQGNSTASSVNLGLFDSLDQLIACMTFCKLRGGVIGKETAKLGEYELLRFCSDGRVIGGASKLFSYFLKMYKPTKVISYADRHWTSTIKSNVYDKLGFVKTSDGKPNYWYIIRGKREHRFNWRKSVLPKKLPKFNPTLTEYANMLSNGYDRIWGCGSLKYEYLPK
jgi:hypothetical protein